MFISEGQEQKDFLKLKKKKKFKKKIQKRWQLIDSFQTPTKVWTESLKVLLISFAEVVDITASVCPVFELLVHKQQKPILDNLNKKKFIRRMSVCFQVNEVVENQD